MSLDWNVQDIANHEVVTTSPWDAEKWHPVTEALVWGCLATSIRTITKDNVDEYWWRYVFNRRYLGRGSDLVSQGGNIYVTKADVEMHIGLSTNVTPIKSRNKWLATFANSSALHSPMNVPNVSGHELCRLLAEEAKAS